MDSYHKYPNKEKIVEMQRKCRYNRKVDEGVINLYNIPDFNA